jgi:hypothetical protein
MLLNAPLTETYENVGTDAERKSEQGAMHQNGANLHKNGSSAPPPHLHGTPAWS